MSIFIGALILSAGCGNTNTNVSEENESNNEDIDSVLSDATSMIEFGINENIAGAENDQDNDTESSEGRTENATSILDETMLEEQNNTGNEVQEKKDIENIIWDEPENDIDDKNDYAERYIDFEHMVFYANGKEYELGKITLQELVDDEVPFKESSLEEMGKNISPDSEMSFSTNPGGHCIIQVSVLNDSEEKKPASECMVNKIYIATRNFDTQNIFSLAFPMNMTMDELINNSGEPDYSKHSDDKNGNYSDILKYTSQSERYVDDKAYEFDYENGELNYVTITYMP